MLHIFIYYNNIKLKMDKRDLQILELLAQNCRLSHASIGKALRLSKDAITYRINKLETAEFIKSHLLFIDARKLNFTRYHLLLKLEGNLEERQQYIHSFATHPAIMWINTFIGRYDVQIIVDAKDGFDLNRIKEELSQLCNHSICEYFLLTHLYDLEFTQLNPLLDLNTKIQQKNDYTFSELLTRRFPVPPKFNKYSLDHTDALILKELADNPQSSLVDIAKVANIERQTVKTRIDKLIEKNIILSFGAIPNKAKLGYVTYYLLVRLAQDTPLSILRKPFAQLNNIFYAGKMDGDYDMILYLNAKTPQELNSSIQLFTKEIGKHLIHYDLLVQDAVHHWRQYTNYIHTTFIASSQNKD